MNGIHDMGGMHGMGSLEIEQNEAVFHEPWEGRVYAFNRVLAPWGRGRDWGNFRFALESIPAADYLRMSYYERWFTVQEQRMLTSGLVSWQELENGHADPAIPTAELIPDSQSKNLDSRILTQNKPARYLVGQSVRVRELNPPGHIRIPRYIRAKLGNIASKNGVYRMQDTDTEGRRLGEFPQHVYSVKFSSRELWGETGHDGDTIYVDLWEDYLEPV